MGDRSWNETFPITPRSESDSIRWLWRCCYWKEAMNGGLSHKNGKVKNVCLSFHWLTLRFDKQISAHLFLLVISLVAPSIWQAAFRSHQFLLVISLVDPSTWQAAIHSAGFQLDRTADWSESVKFSSWKWLGTAFKLDKLGRSEALCQVKSPKWLDKSSCRENSVKFTSQNQLGGSGKLDKQPLEWGIVKLRGLLRALFRQSRMKKKAATLLRDSLSKKNHY